MKTNLVVIAGVAAALWVVPARADVVPEPPADCPEGTEGQTCHGGPFCQPRVCTQNGDCGVGATCQDQALCIAGIDCSGGWEPDAAPTLLQNAVGTCAGGAACGAPSTCMTLKVCVPAGGGSGTGGNGSSDEDIKVTGCDCRATGSPGDGAATALGALGLCALLAARRRGSSRDT